ncbi:phosphotransferase [Acidisoma cellulosilytica]|uniref:Phosphotransferase n=1 Tax=Acidisoma cellulosilyticum TaxID=2802395 RepID=A0A963Z3P5_9PROT|nr:phosphotransferase [Acidisoma cellulosilyticum]MCB8882024.1 phosphotransferase [Acidisoma cellulosilyticum]
MNLADAIAASPWAGAIPRPGVAAVASPMWQAVEWSNAIIGDGADAIFLKCLEPDMAGAIDPVAAYDGALAAAGQGVGPEVLFASADRQAIGFRYLAAPWRHAWLGDLQNPDVLAGVIAAKKAFRQAPPLTRVWDVFAAFRFWLARAAETGTALPADMPALAQVVDQIAQAITAAGFDLAPGHNDGQASNIMLGSDGAVMLVDCDCAGMSDPYYDLAAILGEACLFEADWRAGIVLHDGACAEPVLLRCRAYSVVDDLLWGLRGLVLSQTSPRRGLEFLKYGEWRLLRARSALRDAKIPQRLNQI